MMTKKALSIAIASLGLGAPFAHAEDTPSPITGNLTFATDYVVRGVTQTNNGPAIQGTLEYGHSSGLYAGLFGSNANWLADGWEPAAPGVDGSIYGGPNSISKSIELDIYAGFRNKFLGDFTYDVGAVYYWYPGEYFLVTPGLKRPETTELYGALGWKWITAKLWYAVSDGVYMVPDAQGTYYANLSATVPIGETGFNIIAAVGMWKWAGTADYLKVENGGVGADNSIYDLTDFRLGATKDLFGFNWGLFYTTSTADKTIVGSTGATTAAWGNRFGKNIGDDSVFLSVTKSF